MDLPDEELARCAEALGANRTPLEREAALAAMEDLIVEEVIEATEYPKPRRRKEGPLMELIVAMPDLDMAVSLRLSHLLRNAVDPRSSYRALAAGGGAASLAASGAPSWLAFALALTSLAARPVSHVAACVLHKAWLISPLGRVVTVSSLVAVASQITAEYGVVKVAPADIQTYLDELARSGALRGTPSGYILQEKVVLKQL